MSDSDFSSEYFVSGSLFTTDYMRFGIRETNAYISVDVEKIRATLGAIAENFPQNTNPNESQTEDDFIWPVLAALDWSNSLRQQNLSKTGREAVPDGLLFENKNAKDAANKLDEWKRYRFGLAVLESKRWDCPLDRASGKVGLDKATAPSSQMLRYLRRLDDHTNGKLRWGILSNGTKWRLYWAGARSVSEEFLQIDLARVLALSSPEAPALSSPEAPALTSPAAEAPALTSPAAEAPALTSPAAAEAPALTSPAAAAAADNASREHWLRVFAVMFSRAAFIVDSSDNRSFHARARAEAVLYEERVAASLSQLVFEQIFPNLAAAIAKAAPEVCLREVREATLVLLYRLLFLLYAEDRNLLPVGDAKYDSYSLRKQRKDIGQRISTRGTFSDSAAQIWVPISELARIIDKGDASIGIPPYNGGLFVCDKTPLLNRIRIPDSVMAPVLDALSYERSTGERRYINYRDLSVQQLGSIYEQLLEFEIVRDEQKALKVQPNRFARKNSGSYYTPDALVGLILEETLEPLITEKRDAFRRALKKRNLKHAQDFQRSELSRLDPAEAILELRICDPAMGSGHFLVSLVDMLADTVLDTMSEATTLAEEISYVSPLDEKIKTIRRTILSNAKEANWTIDKNQLDDRHIIRRMVLKRCVYGVDKNPMAVELAKVSLWLHTFTVGAPLSFIDHHLHAGDSLFGLWVRDAIDKATDLGGGLLWSEALRKAEQQAQEMKIIEMMTDVDIEEVHTSAKTWQGIESQTGPLDSFVSFMHALDWLKLDKVERQLVRHWLDGQFGEPLLIASGQIEPKPIRAKPEEAQAFAAICKRAQSLITDELFFNWQISFPGVWRNWRSAGRKGGFDAVVSNPPWERIKLQQVEWFAERRPEIAHAQRAAKRKTMIAKLKKEQDPLFDAYQSAKDHAANTARMARRGGHYPLLGRGDINLYSLFVERAQALVKPSGIIGLLTPSGIASDLSASAFFRQVSTGGHLKALYDFENKKVFFPDVDSRFKFCVLSFSPTRIFEVSNCAFFLHDTGTLDDPERAFPMSAADFARVNPNTGTAPIFRTRRDRDITTAIYERLPVLGDAPVAAWPVKYATMFHMANDSHLFRTRAELGGKEGAWNTGGNRFESASGKWLPLYEGKMVQAFDHRAADIIINNKNLFRPGQQISLTSDEHRSPDRQATPRYWVLETNDAKRLPTLAFRDIARSTDARTMIAAMIPSRAAGHTLPVLFSDGSQSPKEWAELQIRIVANLNSIVFDFLARQKIHTTHLSWYIVEQLPVVPPSAYARSFGPKTAAQIVREAVLELTYTAHDMAPFARDMGYVSGSDTSPEGLQVLPPFLWDDKRRLNLRAKLDALYFILYGIFDSDERGASRETIVYIYSSFPIVKREETEKWGCYRSLELCLDWVNALMAGQPDAEIGR